MFAVVDTDECESVSSCLPGQQCVNTPGSFTCRCQPGYRPTDTGCTGDITAVYLYIRQVNGLKLADVMFSVLCVCAHGENEVRDEARGHEPCFRRQNVNKCAKSKRDS